MRSLEPEKLLRGREEPYAAPTVLAQTAWIRSPELTGREV
jgi:hypothetical protein